jgi:hypothetical protein
LTDLNNREEEVILLPASKLSEATDSLDLKDQSGMLELSKCKLEKSAGRNEHLVQH